MGVRSRQGGDPAQRRGPVLARIHLAAGNLPPPGEVFRFGAPSREQPGRGAQVVDKDGRHNVDGDQRVRHVARHASGCSRRAASALEPVNDGYTVKVEAT